jgi:hypothetical protein
MLSYMFELARCPVIEGTLVVGSGAAIGLARCCAVEGAVAT